MSERKIIWQYIGDGTKIHAFFPGSNYAVCGKGGRVSLAMTPRSFNKCKSCARRLEKLAEQEESHE